MNKMEQRGTGQGRRRHPRTGKYQRKPSHPWVRPTLIVLMLTVVLCVAGLGGLAFKRAGEEKALKELAQMASQTTVPLEAKTETTASGEAPTAPVPSDPETTDPSQPQTLPVLHQYQALYEKNPEMVGWIRIDDTKVNYPVMHTPQNPEKYLHTDFTGEYSFAGVPFLDAKCSPDSDNLLIYGHNMSDGYMFRSLLKYENRDYWKKHPIIHFDTLYEEQEYEVLAAFYDRVYTKQENVFKFYQFINAEDEEDFDNAINEFRAKALYDTKVEASYGDQLITLVTCAYHTDNGRFVVVARKVQHEPDGFALS